MKGRDIILVDPYKAIDLKPSIALLKENGFDIHLVESFQDEFLTPKLLLYVSRNISSEIASIQNWLSSGKECNTSILFILDQPGIASLNNWSVPCDFINYPFTPEQLMFRVKKMLNRDDQESNHETSEQGLSISDYFSKYRSKRKKTSEQNNFFSTLSKTGLSLLEHDPDEDIFLSIIKYCQLLVGQEIILVISQFDEPSNSLKIRHFLGLNDEDQLIKHADTSLLQLNFNLDNNKYQELLSGRLVELEDLHNVLDDRIGSESTKDLQAGLRLKNIFSIGLVYKNKLLGNILFLEKEANKIGLKNFGNYLEIFALQASMAILREEAEKALSYEMNISRALVAVTSQLFAPKVSYKEIAEILKELIFRYLPGEILMLAIYDWKQHRELYSFGKQATGLVDENMGNIRNSLINFAMNKEKEIIFNTNSDDAEIHSYISKQSVIQNFMILPVYMNHKLVGYVFHANSKKEYHEKSMNILKKIAGVFAMAIYRKQTEEEIISSKEKAEESDRLKTVFLANMSHEIRTPLNGIIGFANLISNRELTEEKKKMYVEIITSNSSQLLSIINDLLDLSKIESGQLNVNLNPVSLNKLLTDLYSEFQISLQRNRKSNLIISALDGLSDDESYILTDELRLKQILSNLVSNAIKFTKDGEINYGYVLVEEINKVRFFVKDTGVGIAQKYQQVIFDSFRQEDESNTRKFGGSGMGLSITKALVEKLGGKIWFESIKDKGSTFYFTIPYKPLLVKN